VKCLAQHVTVFSSQARIADVASPDFKNHAGVGAVVTINVTATTSTPSVVFTLQGKDPTSSQYYNILSSSAIVVSGITHMKVHPDFTAGTNVAKDIMPSVWRVYADHADGDSITYSVGASLI